MTGRMHSIRCSCQRAGTRKLSERRSNARSSAQAAWSMNRSDTLVRSLLKQPRQGVRCDALPFAMAHKADVYFRKQL